MERNVFIYWIGKDYSLIRILRDLMFKHQESGKGYKLHYINPSNIKNYLPNTPRCFDQLLPAHQADFLRINVLNTYGGIWLDSDILIMNNLDYYFDLLKIYSSFFQKQEVISISFFGSRKNNPIMLEWISRAEKLLNAKGNKINWSDIGSNMIEKIRADMPDLFNNTKIINAYDHSYPVKWNQCLEQFCLKNYDNYLNLIPKERNDLIILVNSVYKFLEKKSEEEILNSKMPLNYFLNKSFQNLEKPK
jgi:hypothetical protein